MATTTAASVRAAITNDGRFTKHIHDVKISSRRKSLGMSITPGDPGITLHVPADASPAEVVALLAKNADRLGGLLVKARKHAPDHHVPQLIGGAGFVWLGRSSRLRIVDNATTPLQHVHDGHGWWMELARETLPQGAKPFIDWYIREGTAWINQEREAPRWWGIAAPLRPMPTVRVANIGRTRWGVYDGRTHTVRIAWQTFQLSPELIRHVLVHELTHATNPPGSAHGPEFWRAFERVRPGARDEARRVEEVGRTLWMGDIVPRAA